MKLKEMNKAESQFIEEIDLLVTEVVINETKTGKEYLTVKGTDSTGEALFRVWDPTEPVKNILSVGNIVSLSITGKPYNGAISLEMTKNTMPTVIDGNPMDYKNSFVPEINGMKEYLRGICHFIKEDESLAVVVNELFKGKEQLDKFFYWPAAESMHHAEEYGLLFHTTSIMHHAEALMKSTKECYNIKINERLVLLAILLHDYYKTKEYEMNAAGKGELTKNVLIGHIAMAMQFIGSLYYKGLISEELNIQLSHIVGAHHGKLEWGAVVVPATVEAMIVHVCDYFDSRMYMFKDAYTKLNEGEMASVKSFGLDGVKVYCPAELKGM